MGKADKNDTIKKALIENLKKGNTISASCEACDIGRDAFYEWCKKDKAFNKSVEEARANQIKIVEDALFKRACGYEYDEITYEKSSAGGLGLKLNKGEIKEIKHVDANKVKIVTKQIMPDVLAQIFFLCNRDKDNWRNVNTIEHTGKDGKELALRFIDAEDYIKTKNEKKKDTAK